MKINKIIKVLIISDFSIFSSLGLVSPIFAIFINKQIAGGEIRVAGFASTIYLLVSSLTRIPLSKIVDRKLTESERIVLLIGASVLMSLGYFLYTFAKLPWHVYVLEGLIGLGYAGNVATWYDLFTRYIDKNQESFEWNLHGSLVSLGTALTAAIGGVLAEKFGFNFLFILIGVCGLIGSLAPTLIYKNFTVRDNAK